MGEVSYTACPYCGKTVAVMDRADEMARLRAELERERTEHEITRKASLAWADQWGRERQETDKLRAEVERLTALESKMGSGWALVEGAALMDENKALRAEVEAMRPVVKSAMEQRRLGEQGGVYEYREQCRVTNEAARRLAAAREGK